MVWVSACVFPQSWQFHLWEEPPRSCMFSTPAGNKAVSIQVQRSQPFLARSSANPSQCRLSQLCKTYRKATLTYFVLFLSQLLTRLLCSTSENNPHLRMLDFSTTSQLQFLLFSLACLPPCRSNWNQPLHAVSPPVASKHQHQTLFMPAAFPWTTSESASLIPVCLAPVLLSVVQYFPFLSQLTLTSLFIIHSSS